MSMGAATFSDENPFTCKKLKKNKSREIFQYQHAEESSESDVDHLQSESDTTVNTFHVKNNHDHSKNGHCSNKDKNVYLEPLKGKQKRPKFLFDFKIFGLNNIPLFDGADGNDKFSVCYVKWSLLDNSQDHLFKSKKTSKNNIVYLRDDEALKFFYDGNENQDQRQNLSHNYDFSKMSRDDIEEAASKNLPKTDYMHPSATNPGMYKVIAHNNRKGATKRHKISNNYCAMNYQLESPVIVKINIDEKLVQDLNSKRTNRNKITRALKDEFLVIECYHELLQVKRKDHKHKGVDYRKQTLGNTVSSSATSSTMVSTSDTISISSVDSNMLETDDSGINKNFKKPETANSNHKVLSRMKIGEVKINLAEYVKESEEWQTNFFLLQDSKVNSVLKFSCHLKLVRGSYNEFDLATEYTSGQLPGSIPRLYKKDVYSQRVSKKKNKNGSVINDSGYESEDFADFPTELNEIGLIDGITKDIDFEKMKLKPSEKRIIPHDLNSAFGRESTNALKLSLLTTLKHKNFIDNYLRNPYEYENPRDCIKDILDGKSGWNIDAIFTAPSIPSKNSNQNTLEMGRLLDKYGSNQKIKKKSDIPKSFHKSSPSRVKTTGGWYYTNFTKYGSEDDESKAAYSLNDIWGEFEDSENELDQEID